MPFKLPDSPPSPAAARPSNSPNPNAADINPHKRLLKILACSLTLLLLTQAACTNRDAPSPLERMPMRPEYVGRLHVLHVAGEVGKASGYPLSETLAVASSHQFKKCHRAAAVESLPMMAGATPSRVQAGRTDLPARNDWVVLCGSGSHFTPNAIDPNVDLKVGDRVLMGGFPLVYEDCAVEQFWDMPPSVIEGRVVELCAGPGEFEGLVLIDVPQALYNGFSGGPAAIEDANGELRVWGTIVHQGWWLSLGHISPTYVLCVARLPADVKEGFRWWCSYK